MIAVDMMALGNGGAFMRRIVSLALLAATAAGCDTSRVARPAAIGVTHPVGPDTFSAVPRSGTLLVVDSFTVVEYRASCAWECPFLAYAPLLKLREPSGSAAVTVVSVEF